jgi:hypothetical protein
MRYVMFSRKYDLVYYLCLRSLANCMILSIYYNDYSPYLYLKSILG